MSIAPGVTQNLPLPYGSLGQFLRDPLDFQLQAREHFGDIFRIRVGPLVNHFLYHPDHVRRVLHDEQKNYLRGWHFRILQKLFGQSLTTSEGAFWLRQRRLAQPAFQRHKISEYASIMVDAASEMVARWREMAPHRNTIDARREMSRIVLDITSRTLFGRDVDQEADQFGNSFAVLGQYFDYRLHHPVSAPPTWVPTSTNRQFKTAVATINRMVTEIVQERLHSPAERGDLLSMLIQARDEETGEGMTDEQLRSEIVNFLLAGYETTATALTWTWYLLGTHASIRQRVREEVAAVVGDRLPRAADAHELHFTRAVIQESLRLYPPVWIIPRQVVAADEIDGYRIPARSMVVLCPYITHRHPEFWDAPDSFDPDRFTDERMTTQTKGSYFPFLSGPHQCIGNEFAMLEMQLVIARVLQEFDVSMEPGEFVKPVTSLGLWPDRRVLLAISQFQNTVATRDGRETEMPSREWLRTQR